MKKMVFLGLSFLFLVVNLQAQNSKADKKQMKKEQAEKEYQATKELIESDSYSFVAIQTTPLGGQRIWLYTTPNYVNIENGEADIYLPYYGVVRAGIGYGADAGIKFKGSLENYKVEANDSKQYIRISFDIQRNNEAHEFNFTVYRGASANLALASNRRNATSYMGEVSKLEMPLTN